MERPYDNSETPRYIQTPIEDLLSRYHEARETDARWSIERLIPIDGHEVAWMKYEGVYESGETYEERELRCACHFTEGVGWMVHDEWGATSLSGGDRCLPREIAAHLRHRELQEEYITRLSDGSPLRDKYILWQHIPEIVEDLIRKDKNGEFIGEKNSGAHGWGGHFYAYLLHDITEIDYDKLWPEINKLVDAKKIQLDGMVVQEYYDLPEPSWTEHGRFEYEGYTGIAYLPDHDHMSQQWQITILAPNQNILAESLVGPNLVHEPIFGADDNDIATVERYIREVIDGYLIDPMSQA